MNYKFLFITLWVISFAQSQSFAVNQIPDSLLDGANAVVRLHKLDIQISSVNSMTLKYNRVITILNESGDALLNAYAGYDSSIKVKSIEAIVYNSTGEVLQKFKKSDFADISAVDGFSLYTDSRVKILKYFPTVYPYTVAFEYELSTDNTGYLPSWEFIDDFMVSMEKSSYSIEFANDELKPNIKESNFELYNIKKTEESNKITYTLSAVKWLRDEELSPDKSMIFPKVYPSASFFYYEGFEGKINSWKDLGNWINNNMLENRDVLPEATIRKIQSLVIGVNDTLEKAKIVFDYVQKNTRYVSVQVGIGGIQPISAAEVDEVKYGDCKGLSNYTQSLLKAVGITSYYVHVEAGKSKIGFFDDFASLAQGNHVILAIPYKGDLYWVDSTSQTIPFGFIANFTDDRNVMLVTPEGGKLAKTKKYNKHDNTLHTGGNYKVNEQGLIIATVNMHSKGVQYANHYYLEDLDEDEIDKYYKKYWSNINNLKLQEYSFVNDKMSISFTENVQFNAPNYASITNEGLLLRLNAFNQFNYVPPRYRIRKLPFEISRSWIDKDEYDIEIPEGFYLDTFPDEINITSTFGHYMLKVHRLNSGALKLTREMSLNEGVYPSTDYEEYRNFLKKISKYDQTKVLLKKT